jgi:hypothetical protein
MASRSVDCDRDVAEFCIAPIILREQLYSANDSSEKSFAGLMLQYAHGDVVDIAGRLTWIPVRLKSVREYARTVLEPCERAAVDAPTVSS